jgi:hypothetical protein
MPTTLKRHMVTEVPALESALYAARAAGPEERSTSKLIVKLAELGAAQLQEDRATAVEARRARLEALSGRFHYKGGLAALAELHKEWD